jgi:outer membrane protein TolC
MKRLVFAACLGALLVAPSRPRALTLAEGLALLERGGRDAALSAAEEQVLRSAEVLAGAARRPTLDAYATETLLAQQPAAVAGAQTLPLAEKESFAFGVRARQLLYDFGRTASGVRAAGLDTEWQRLETGLVRNRAALRFIGTYVRLLRAERLLALQREEVTRFEAHRDDTRAMLEEGTITENDLLQAEVRLADAVQRRLQAENQQALAAAQVNSLLARPLGVPVAPEEVPAPGPDPLLEDALALAVQQRGEMAQIRARVAATEARRAAAAAEYRPTLFVAGGYDYEQNKFMEHADNWSVRAGVDLNLFSGGVTGEKLRQKDRELAVLERTRELVADAVGLDVQEAFLALRTARSRVAATGKAVEQAQENLRLQKLRFAEGVGTATDVLDAVSLATTAEQNALNARYDVTDALARLDFAVGRDLALAWGGVAPATQGGEHP